MELAIKVENLFRTYSLQGKNKQVTALNGISFNVMKGEVFGLLGPNGAGKTTTIKILTTLLAPTAGECKVLGFNTFGQEQKIRPRINFIFGGELGVYRRLTARENLVYFANLYKLDKDTRLKRIVNLLELVGLTNRADHKVETYSKGMIQRLQIARGLINDPDVLFLDEPTLGLDPVGARELREIIRNLKNQNKTILLTTHYMYEADELCSRIAIINKGNIIALDTPENLKNQSKLGKVIELNVSGIYPKDLDAIKSITGIETVAVRKIEQNQILQIHCDRQLNIVPEVLQLLKEYSILSIIERDTTLEDVYVCLVGGNV